MGALVLGLAFAALLVWVVRPARRRRTVSASADAPSRLLDRAIDALPADRAPWGEAMAGELDQIGNRWQRWRFALGCASAVVFVPSRRADSAGLAVRFVAAAALTCAGLTAYALERYPGIVTRSHPWPVLTVFVLLLAGYTAISAFLIRRGPITRSGLAFGLAMAAVWIIAGIPVVTQAHQGAYSFLLLAIPIASLAVGAVAGRRRSTVAVRQPVVMLSALVAGLVLFAVYASEILLTAGGPYDAGQIRDFPGSGLPDLATYAVSDNLGSAMMLLLLVPAVTAAIGSAAAALAVKLPPRQARA